MPAASGGGKQVKVPAITAAAAVLVSRGADQLLVPTPSAYEEDRVAEELSGYPSNADI